MTRVPIQPCRCRYDAFIAPCIDPPTCNLVATDTHFIVAHAAVSAARGLGADGFELALGVLRAACVAVSVPTGAVAAGAGLVTATSHAGFADEAGRDVAEEESHGGECAGDDDEVCFDEDPDPWCDDCPCLVDCLEHGEEEEESYAAGDACRRSDTEYAYQSCFLHPRHLQVDDHRYWKDQKNDVRSHVENRCRHVQRCSVEARAACDEDVEVLHHWRAGKDQREDEGDIVADHQEHVGVDGDPEPS